MIISVASLTLRFYERDGWAKAKVRKLLVNPKMEITWREGNKALLTSGYYAVYENSGHKVFKKSEMSKHTFSDNQRFQGIEWYLREDK